MPWIIDPSEDNAALENYLCSPSDPKDCGIERSCEFDPQLQYYSHINGSCSPEGCYSCLHKELIPFALSDALGTAVLFLGGILAGASGIGGGGLNVPLLLLVVGFFFEEAVPISHVMVFGNAIAQNLVNCWRRHPVDRRRPIIDFDVPLILLPMQLGGNSIGVLLSPVLPSGLLLLMACIVLAGAAMKTLRRGVHDLREELRASKAARAEPQAARGSSSSLERSSKLLVSHPAEALLPTATLHSDAPEHMEDGRAAGAQLSARGSAQLNGEADGLVAPHQNALKAGGLLCFWLLFVFDYFGVKLTHSPRCSLGFLAWQLLLFAAVLLAVVPGVSLARRSERSREMLEGDVDWTSTRRVVALLAAALLIGVLSGLLGLGGGELMAPLLLALGMPPQVASATSGFMVLFNSSSNLVHYLAESVLTPMPGYVVWAGTIGFFSALTGRLFSILCTSRLHHPSLVVFALGSLLLISMALLIIRAAKERPSWDFNTICTS